MSDMPSIMRTVTPSQSATPASISEGAQSIAQSVKKSVTPVKNDGGVDIIKIILIVAIVGFLAYNLYLYFTEGTDVLGKYFGIGIKNFREESGKSIYINEEYSHPFQRSKTHPHQLNF